MSFQKLETDGQWFDSMGFSKESIEKRSSMTHPVITASASAGTETERSYGNDFSAWRFPGSSNGLSGLVTSYITNFSHGRERFPWRTERLTDASFPTNFPHTSLIAPLSIRSTSNIIFVLH